MDHLVVEDVPLLLLPVDCRLDVEHGDQPIRVHQQLQEWAEQPADEPDDCLVGIDERRVLEVVARCCRPAPERLEQP